jgi:hypothetical protein
MTGRRNRRKITAAIASSCLSPYTKVPHVTLISNARLAGAYGNVGGFLLLTACAQFSQNVTHYLSDRDMLSRVSAMVLKSACAYLARDGAVEVLANGSADNLTCHIIRTE